MIDASIVRRIQSKRADDLHRHLCAKIEHAITNAAMDSRTELLVQLPNAMQLAPHTHTPSIRLETYAYDIERLQFVLKNAGYEIDTTAYKNSFMIKW